MQGITVSEWSQLKYGKVVQAEDGPIVKGAEHKVTGVSNSVPESFKTVMVPSVLGIGNNDRTNWREFTWHETGGMTIQIREHDGQHFMIGGKIIGRSESGKALGRMYTESHYACLLISEHQFPSTMGLYKALHTTPQIADQPFELPNLQVDNTSVDLEDNWLDFVAPVLRIVLSGLPLSIKTTRRKMEEMVEFVHIVQSCLPNTLAWRLTSKIGALECPPGEAVLSFVEASNYEVPRMIGFSKKDPEKNIQKLKDVVGGEPYPDLEDTLIGERYIEYLRMHCAQCTNTHQLQQQIQADFPNLQRWDYFAADKSLETAGVEFLQVLFEDDALTQLRAALSEGGQFPSLNRFYHRKKEALSLLLEHIWEHPTVVLKSLTQWENVWQELSKECSAELSCIMDLLMSNRTLSAESFQPLLGDIPQPFHRKILGNLDRWVDQLHSLHSTDDTVLPAFLSLHEELPSWITDWIAGHQQKLSLILRYIHRSTDAKAFLPFAVWLDNLSQEVLIAIHQEDTIQLKSTLKEQPSHIVDALIEELYSHSPLIVIQWVLTLGFSSNTGPGDSRLSQIQNWKGLLKSVWTAESHTLLEEFKSLDCNTAYSSKLLERLLAEVFTALPTNDQDRFWPLLSTNVGKTVAQYRFGRESTVSNGNFDSLFIAEFAELYRKGHASLQSLFVDVAESNATLPRRHELIGVCKQVFKYPEHTHPLPKTLRDIQAGQMRSIAGIKPKWIQFWCTKLDLTIELNSIEHSDSLCRFFFELNPQFQEPSYTLLKRLIKAKEDTLPAWTDWEHDLQEAKWHEKPGWRLLFIEYTPEKPLQDVNGNSETMFLKMSNLEMRAKLLRLGFLVDPSHFDSLTIEEFSDLSPEAQSILVWYGLHFAEEKLGETVARGWIIAMNPQDRTALRSELSSAFSMFSSLVQQVSDYFDETPTTLPQQMTPTEWVKEYLLTLPKEKRLSLLVD